MTDLNNNPQGPQLPFKKRLKNGENLTGTFVTFLQGPDVVQFLKGIAGFDFFVLDTEHASYDYAEIREMILAARASQLYSLVRILEPGHHESRVLDMGADGIVIPLVETREQAEVLVQYGRYLPEGKRGISSVNGHNDFSKPADMAQFIADRNRDVLLFVMIESRKGVTNREEILSTPGIDGCILGTGDLAMDLGLAGQSEFHPTIIEEVNKVIDTCHRHNLIVSLPIRKPEEVDKWVKSGINMIIFASDGGILGAGAKLYQSALQETLKSR